MRTERRGVHVLGRITDSPLSPADAARPELDETLGGFLIRLGRSGTSADDRCMSGSVFHLSSDLLAGLVANSGWNLLVKSMKGALDDRSHVTNLGYAIAAILFVWINYRLAKWILARFDRAQHDH